MVFHTKPTPDEFNENVFENVNEELEKEIIQNVSNIYIYIYRCPNDTLQKLLR